MTFDRIGTLRQKDYVLSQDYVIGAEACPGACIYIPPKEKPSQAQWHGIMLHKFLELAQTKGRYAALAYIKKKFKNRYSFCEKLNLTGLPENALSEPHYIIDTETGEAYQANDFGDAIVGRHTYVRCDTVFYDETVECWHTGDYKSGLPTPERPQIDPATSVQMKTQALAVWLNNGRKHDVLASIINVGNEKLKGGKTQGVAPIWKTASFTDEDHLAHLKRLRRVQLTINETRADFADGVEPEFIVSAACAGCKNRYVCPTYLEHQLEALG